MAVAKRKQEDGGDEEVDPSPPSASPTDAISEKFRRIQALRMPEQIKWELAELRRSRLVHPQGPRYRLWKKFIAIWEAYAAVVSPFQFGFVAQPPLGLIMWDAVIDLLFAIDMGLTFFVAYRDVRDLTLATERRKRVRRYASHGLIPDILSTIPYSLLWYLAAGHPPHGRLGDVLRLLVCLRIYRLGHVYELLSQLGRKHRYGYMIIRLSKLFINILLGTHYAGIIYFYIATVESDPDNSWIGQGIGTDWKGQGIAKQYIATIYWSVFTITSIGPAYSANTTPEQIFITFYALFGMAVHEEMQALQRYAARHGLPQGIRAQLRAHLEMQLHQELGMFLEQFPRHLQVSEMKLETVMPNTVVVTEGDVATHLYIVVSGTLVRDFCSGSNMVAELGPGSVFGKMAVLCNVPQLLTVRTLGLCQLLKLDKQAFSHILRAYPREARQILANLKEARPHHLKCRIRQLLISSYICKVEAGGSSPGQKLLVQTRAEVSSMTAELASLIEQHDAELSTALCAAAAMGDLGRLQALVKGPASASTPDYAGRTPLHLAARQGFEDCVHFLIEEGGDTLAADQEVSTPLLEAVKAGQPAVIEILLKAGAQLRLPDPGTFLCGAAALGDLAHLRRLLRCGADFRARDYTGRTALHIACAKQNIAVVQLLVESGGDVLMADDAGETPISLARASSNKRLLDIVQQRAIVHNYD
eukprot:SM000008S22214  [mRNA]  locus=s8:389602:395422:- [translate_table: standard]